MKTWLSCKFIQNNLLEIIKNEKKIKLKRNTFYILYIVENFLGSYILMVYAKLIYCIFHELLLASSSWIHEYE